MSRCLLLALLGALVSKPTFADVPLVMTDILPVQSLVAQVMGDLGTPELLLSNGADEHDFQLKPSQMTALSKADLVIWIGPELTPWLDRALNSTEDVPQLALLRANGTKLLPYIDFGHIHSDSETPNTEHSDIDPHAWLSPDNAEIWLAAIAGELSRLDPENADQYDANATIARTRLSALDSTLASQLAPIADRGFITFHAAYGYLTEHYNLHTEGSVALGDAATPGASQLQALRDRLSNGDIICAFPEAQHDPKLLSQALEGSGTRLGEALDPVGAFIAPGPLGYETLMKSLTATLVACLSG